MTSQPNIDDNAAPQPRLLVNLGCGGVTPGRWINTDKSWHLILKSILPRRATRSGVPHIRYLNLSDRWPFADGGVDVVYLSHVLEHLDAPTRSNVLTEAARVLKIGGVLRIVVPDLYQLCRNYVAEFDGGDAKAAGRLLYWQNLHRENVYPRDRSWLKRAYDYLQGYPKLHLTMYDRLTLDAELASPHWGKPQYLIFGQSLRIPEIGDVEGGQEVCASLYLEVLRMGISSFQDIHSACDQV
jgi:SAM-dependent methyltransferase